MRKGTKRGIGMQSAVRRQRRDERRGQGWHGLDDRARTRLDVALADWVAAEGDGGMSIDHSIEAVDDRLLTDGQTDAA